MDTVGEKETLIVNECLIVEKRNITRFSIALTLEHVKDNYPAAESQMKLGSSVIFISQVKKKMSKRKESKLMGRKT